ncbi:MAG: hypothetical protein K2H45_04255 [Acetatifactor sp.]|nr:hypothetical protein [Acetatifactor sp.]
MEQILYAKTYQEYKAELDTELSKTAEGFVRIGYLLKVARDTSILEESPYQTVTEFAKAEYGIDKTMVSRFISINDRFSEGGYSDQLKEQYRGYGYAKLTLMLSLPDEINQELSTAYSKVEIQAIKNEVDEERAISDLEVMMEPRPVPAPVKGLLNMLIYQLGEDSPDLYVQMAGITAPDLQEWTRKTKEIMAPDSEKTYSIRISGTGRFLMSIRETEDTITVTALRTLEKNCYTYQELLEAWEEILPPTGTPDTDWSERDLQTSWELTYNREYPGKVKVAPAQQSEKPQKAEAKTSSRKESKVQKAPKPTPAKTEPPVKEKQPVPEPEKPESTGTEEVSAPKVGFAPGMRVRNKTGKPAYPTGDPCYPQSTATIIGRHSGFDAWDAKWDDIPMTKLIYDIDIKEFEVVEQGDQQPEENTQADTSVEEQLPGQIGIKEAIKEAEERKGAVSYIEPDIPQTAAGQEPDLDKEWEDEKEELLDMLKKMNTEGSLLSRNLSQIPYVHIAALRESLINMAALIEKELLRRGEKF